MRVNRAKTARNIITTSVCYFTKARIVHISDGCNKIRAKTTNLIFWIRPICHFSNVSGQVLGRLSEARLCPVIGPNRKS
jgi:hypothetical protein